MYEKLLKQVEGWVLTKDAMTIVSTEALANYLDLIIKIKTIQALDTSADLIRASRQVGRN